MAEDKYLFFDGTNYISPCDCNINIYDYTNTPQIIDPNNCVIKYYDGANWCDLVCPCECPAGYEFSYITNDCVQQESAVYTGTTATLAQGHQDRLYTSNGLRLYNDLSAYTLPLLGNVVVDPFQLIDNNGAGVAVPLAISPVQNRLWGVGSGTCIQDQTQGRLNTIGIWPTGYPKGTELAFEYCIELAAPKQYLFGMTGDDMTLSIDSGSGFVDQVKLRNSISGTNYDYNWWVFPITLPAGTNVIKFSGQELWGVTGSIGFEIYDMGDIGLGPNAPYASPYDKFVDFLTDPAGTSPACGNDETDVLPFLEFTSNSLIGFDVAAAGSAGTWSCPDGSAVNECNGTPQCIDSIPCTGTLQPPLISNTTEINVWFDNSGSMNTTLAGLNEMINSSTQSLRECLLPIYNNDLALYNERVKVHTMFDQGGAWNYNERFIRCLGEGRNFQRTADTNVTQVINLTFADESNVYGYGSSIQFDNQSREPQFDTDVAYTRNQQATLSYDVRGTQFRVSTGNNQYPGFRGLSQATFVNNGVYQPNNNLADYYGTKYNVNLDTLPGQSGLYYRNLVVAALNALGLNVPVCP